MSCLLRILFAGLGWTIGGPMGSVVGLMLAGLFSDDSSSKSEVKQALGNTTQQRDFNVTLLVLSAAVMKADGVVKKSELDYVKRFFLHNFGQERAENYIKMLREILKKDYNLYDVSTQVERYMDYSSRLQLLHYLFGIAKADGFVSEAEMSVLQTIASYMRLASSDFESIKAMFVESVNELDNSYKILGVDASATDDELKKAYRDMAKKYHPDLVSHLGEDVRLDAEKKFQEVNDAYERIKKSRGIV